MQNKKFLKTFGLSAVLLLGLAACGSVTAKPTNYNDPLINIEGFGETIYHNNAKVVYDAIHEQGIGENVLNEILYLYAVKEFGAYDATVVAGGVKVNDGEITLSVAAEDANKRAEFIKSHKVYWDSDREDESAPISATENARVIAKFDTINDRIAEKLYAKISSGSYSDRHIFSEAKLLKDLRKSLEHVADPTLLGVKLYTGKILPNVEPKDVFKGTNPYLHLENYQSGKNTYVVEKMMPEIYRELLNELYVFQENYNTLGRSYARKVNIIEIKNNDNYPNASFYLAKALVNDLHNDLPVPNDENPNPVLKLFRDYSYAYTGTDTADGSTTENILLVKAAGGFGDTVGSHGINRYYTGTEYGDLAAKYIKMLDSKSVDTSAEATFTNSGAYPVYVGLQQQKIELEEKDYVTSGWFIKNGGLSDLPEAIRNRLFNIAVANGVKERATEQAEVERDPQNWNSDENDPNAYVCRINGHNYLKKAERVKGDSCMNDILHYDASSKTYYIVEIEEAVSTSKLNDESNNNYEHTRSATVMQDVINDVNKLVAAGESYASLAAKKYLEAMEIKFHDDSVYNYFVENYPELFD